MNQKQLRIIARAARRWGIAPSTLYGVKITETGPDSGVGEVSPAGAKGPFQFMPPTAASYHINPNNFRQAANAAAEYLSKSKPKGFARMLSDYNAGPGGALQPDYVSSVRKAAAGWPGGMGGGGGGQGQKTKPFKSNVTPGLGLLSAFGQAQGQQPSKYENYLATVAQLNQAATPFSEHDESPTQSGEPSWLTDLQSSTDDMMAQNASFIQHIRSLNNTPMKLKDNEASKLVDPNSPAKLQTIIERATKMNKLHQPYVWGGGHGASPDYNGPWDCSGAVSAVLGVDPRVSGQFASWGKPGEGKHVTIYANGHHVLMKINGKFFGTSGSNPGGGAGWIPASVVDGGYLSSFVKRHPVGL